MAKDDSEVKRVLVLGASGMLGNAIYRYFFDKSNVEVWGAIRSNESIEYFPEYQRSNLIVGVNVEVDYQVLTLIESLKPTFLINCIGVIKQSGFVNDKLQTLSLNTMLPHKLAQVCSVSKIKFIHISTDCVFSGKKGLYMEKDRPDATDLYGLSKRLGEIEDGNALTLRTSIIGHELFSNKSLIDWFLSQEGSIGGYNKAIFSGLPTIYLARVIDEYILVRPDLSGLYHLSVDPISKYDLLNLVKSVYKKNISISPNSDLKVDRSLVSKKFQDEVGYTYPSWQELIAEMYNDYKKLIKVL